MNIKKLLCIISVTLMLSGTADVLAETRNIYIGDIISLEIESGNLYEDELREKFQAFEIIELQRTPEGYFLSIRTFDVGERKILIGDKEIVISVASTLNDIQSDDVFEGNIDVLDAGFYFHWRMIFYTVTGIFLLSAAFILSKMLVKKKAKSEPPYLTFKKCAENLSVEDDSFLVDLTFYFKEYIEKIKNCRIIGKTSTEIVNALTELCVLEAMLPDVEEWLTECDRLKFADIHAPNEEKYRHYTRLLAIAEKIEMNEGIT